jgi:hypothetical protein
MKKILYPIFLFILIGCTSTPSQKQIILPDWNEEQKIARSTTESQHISNEAIFINKNILGIMTYFAYDGYLYNFPVKISEDFTWLIQMMGLRNDVGFPRAGSADSLIMWECINNFIERSGAKPGDYIQINIREFTREQWMTKKEATAIIYFVGRIEADYSIRGSIWRRP